MAIFFLILIIVTSVIIGFFILVQNPKGGGLAGNIAGFSTQFMGVKQTTDVLEKGTWIIAIVIAVLTVISPVFISPGSRSNNEPNLRPTSTQPAPASTLPAPQQQIPSPAKP
ncbi:MAG TPA: preprotein translocase subunit SecG [Flavitalea sp.]|nr:preprotein translocase subunit SecG [Flavitalea sp.]